MNETPWVTTTPLFPHQERAIEKLKRTRVAALFMEMGTGKSRTAIGLVALRLNRIDHVIWFCPVSNKETTRYEIAKHTNGATVYVFDHKTTAENIPKADWYIVGTESMSSGNRVTLAVASLITESTFVIMDESSYIKHYKSRRTHRITFLSEKARYRLILTGTPISEGIVDLFSQLKFLSPKILGYRSFYSFARNHLEYSEKYPGMIVRTHNTKWLAAKIQPYTYQVTKAESIDLPSKLYESRYCSMTVEQAHCYRQAKEEILGMLDDIQTDWQRSYIIFRLFGALQQIVCGYWRRRDPDTGQQELIELEHERLATALSAIRDVPAQEKVIVWSKYHYSISQVVAALRDEYGPESTAEFHGRLSESMREAQLRRWRAGPARFLVATQAAGSHGLTLNEAHYVVFYSNEFKYSIRAQAEDRCHRIGQSHPVTYIDVVCGGTIDDRIANALSKKANAAAVFRREVNDVKDDLKMMKELIKKL